MIQIDEQTARAVNKMSRDMPEEWAIMEHYIALCIINTRDRLESTATVGKDGLAGESRGLRALFGLKRKAFAKIEGKVAANDMEITGEEGLITDPIEMDEDTFF